jgi:5-methylcytosine-specific restriction enzyme subunit McrC
MPEIKVTESTFSNIVYNRKTESYKRSIEIARLILLQYHPDVTKGKNNVLALMFDMNKLWEKFVYVSLRKNKQGDTTITAQSIKYFWQPENGYRSKLIPDIVINKGKENSIVLDTKWKNLNGFNPSPEDLRQMYLYHEYYRAKKAALIYPGIINSETSGKYLPTTIGGKVDKECSVISISVPRSKDIKTSIVREWQSLISEQVNIWINKSL